MDELRQIWPDWEIIEVLGQGSYGTVLKARKKITGHGDAYSAIKIVTLPLNSSEVGALQSSGMDYYTIRGYYRDMAEKLIAEISIMESLKSVNEIVHIQDFKIIEDPDQISWRIYIRMELLDNINDYMKKHPFTVNDVVRLGMDVCKGLAKCQEKGIIHRDIKPANIMVDEYGTFKLGDFGIAREVDGNLAASTKAGAENYMAPEIYRGESYDQTVDIYSLGITMYQFLNNGRMPFLPPHPIAITSTDIIEARMKRLQGNPIPAPAIGDENLSYIVTKACAFNPRERYQSARQMLEDLERWMKGQEPAEDPGSTPDSKHTSGSKSDLMKIIIPVISVCVAAAVIIAAVIMTRQPGKGKVDLLDSITLVYQEEDDGTYSIVKDSCTFNASYNADNENEVNFVSQIDKSDYEFSRTDNLQLGDTFTISVNVDQELLDQYDVKLAKKSVKHKFKESEIIIPFTHSSTTESNSNSAATIVNVYGSNGGEGYIGQSGSDYRVYNICDGILSTALNTKEDGTGAIITFVFDQKITLHNFTIYNGYCKSETTYYNNRRITQCTLYFDDDTYETFDIDDIYYCPQTFEFDSKHETNTVRLVIEGTTDSYKYDDTCISEVSFNSEG